MRRLLTDLWKNLNSGFAFALFLRRGLGDFRFGIDQLFMMLLFCLAIEVAIDYLTIRPDPSFNHFAFSYFGMEILLFTLSAYLLARLFKRSDAILPLLLISYSTALPFKLVETGMLEFSGTIYEFTTVGYYLLVYGLIVWGVSIVIRAALHAFEVRRRAALVMVPVFAMVWLWPLTGGGWDKDFWYARYTPSEDRYTAYRDVDAETLLYAQPRMVGEALQQVAAQRPGVSDLYFVSFGSYALQDVFMKEVRYAQRTMDARFDTGGHSLELVNNLKTRDELPLATETNLRAVLHHLGQTMDSEEDVLMLYLSSHGSEKHELAVNFWPLPLNDITPDKLRQMLDEAGIKWRVIVVSACYSGGFIDVLRDENTLVATASAKDRQSFGCSNENDFTYYGEALFRDELGRGVPLLPAFRQAREAIHAREQREKLKHSLPQLHVGRLIEQKLEQMDGPKLIECGAEKETVTTVEC